MKIILTAKLKKAEIIADNRPSLVSFFKNAFSSYNKELFNKYYTGYVRKNFCFSLKLNHPVFNGDNISLSDETIEMIIHTYSIEDGIDIYNSLCMQKGKEYPLPENNGLTLTDVCIRNHKQISSNEILIKMYSPLLVRKHENNKDYFLTPEHGDFDKYFSMSVSDFLTREEIYICNDVEIIPVNPKKTVPISFGYKVTGNLGTFKLRGNPELLNLLYQSGIGSKRSQGFGLFEII